MQFLKASVVGELLGFAGIFDQTRAGSFTIDISERERGSPFSLSEIHVLHALALRDALFTKPCCGEV